VSCGGTDEAGAPWLRIGNVRLLEAIERDVGRALQCRHNRLANQLPLVRRILRSACADRIREIRDVVDHTQGNDRRFPVLDHFHFGRN
jgi:hypothetical protein